VELAVTNSFEQGRVLLIDKPLGWTSFDAVRKIKHLVRAKVGHAGTLDPLATGLLILCTGKFTKRLNEFMAQEKEYTGTFTLGATTPTFDLESEPVATGSDLSVLSPEHLERVRKTFIGEILQVPPAHSAIKKDGHRVYKLARRGEQVQLDPRAVTIREFELNLKAWPVIQVRVVCSTGTYIRSLAFDFGAALGCGAYLSSLRRTRIGQFHVDQAMTIEEAETQIRAELLVQNG
jgi:tRNA pseudouridine55 synthase